jgi:hypothetical protein
MVMFDEFLKQAPLSNVNEWVNAFSFLSIGSLLSNWQNVKSQCNKNLFQEDTLLCLIIVVPWHTRNRKDSYNGIWESSVDK